MRKLFYIGLLFCLISCGIKNDPVPPTKATDWGKSLKNVDNKDSEKDETKDQ